MCCLLLLIFLAFAMQARASGIVINTMGWVEGLGYQLLLHSCKTLKVDVILVVGQERLYSQMAAEFKVGNGSRNFGRGLGLGGGKGGGGGLLSGVRRA